MTSVIREQHPYLSPSGFGFVPEFANILTGKPAQLRLRVRIPDVAEVGSIVRIDSSDREVLVLSPETVISPIEGYESIGEAIVMVEGRQVGADAIITGSVNGHRAQALVSVISKREPRPPSPDPKKNRGFIRDIKFESSADPRQRVRFDNTSAEVFVATKAPSVAMYIGPNGEGADEPQGQVLLAELVTEAVCREIARRGVDQQKFLSIPGNEYEAIQREYIRLQNKYAHMIHSATVKQLRSDRKGAPTKQERFESAVVPV